MNISQTELAKKVGISKQTLYKYENDIVTNIPSDKLESIADNLGVMPSYLMGWDVNEVMNAVITAENNLSETDCNNIPLDVEMIIKTRKISELYCKASPEIRKAVDLLLEASQQHT